MTIETDQILVMSVRVSNFRALRNVQMTLGPLTVLIGANNAGKSSYLDAMNLALGVSRRPVGVEEIFVTPVEGLPPKDRKAVIDVLLRPLDEKGQVADTFSAGSYWTTLWGTGISQDEDFRDLMAFRTTLSWDLVKGEYTVRKKFLKEWRAFDQWLLAEEKEEYVNAAHLEPITLHYIDAKRDLEDDLRRPGSFWRRLTDDLGIADTDIAALEHALSQLNQSLIDKSAVLKHLKAGLSDLSHVVAAQGAAIEIAPVARRMRDLSKGIDVSFASSGQHFPLTRHGMGTRSLASLLVFRSYVAWKTNQIESEGDRLHPLLALEEPESHLHPQAQRAAYAQIRSIPGQRLISTHSPYIAGQADLASLRLIAKNGAESYISQLEIDQLDVAELNQLERMVVATRGDLLFAKALVLSEGDTEEQALPIWADKFWNATVHQSGFAFVGIGGSHYFPFLWLAKSLGIPWYIFSDGEPLPLKRLESALTKAGVAGGLTHPQVFHIPGNHDFEGYLMSLGYEAEAEAALDHVFGAGAFEQYMKSKDGQKGKGGVIRDYKSAGGRQRALLDMLRANKTVAAAPLASRIGSHSDPARRIPTLVQSLLSRIASDLSLPPAPPHD